MAYCIKQTDSRPEDFLFKHKRVYFFGWPFFFCFIEPLPLNYHIKYNIRPYQKWLGHIIYKSLKAKQSGFSVSRAHIVWRFSLCVLSCFQMKWIKMKGGSCQNKVKRYFLQFFGVSFFSSSFHPLMNVRKCTWQKGIIKILVSICGLLGFVCGWVFVVNKR